MATGRSVRVTAFLRDPDVFAFLERRVLPVLVRAARAEGTVRAWVPGCATGEEAYTLAILLSEAAERDGGCVRPLVIATDIDGAALAAARAGRYAPGGCARLGAERLARFFRPDGDAVTASPALRDVCVFAAHDLASDPHIGGLDLLSCRNVLIYFDAPARRRALDTLHAALRPGGVLVLGPAEGLGDHAGPFEPLDRRLRIFRRSGAPLGPTASPPAAAPTARPSDPAPSPPGGPGSEVAMVSDFERILLREIAPACVVVDAGGAALHFSGPIGQYLEPKGTPSRDVVELAREDVRLELRAALQRARADGAVAVERCGPWPTGRGELTEVVVRPLPSPDGPERTRYLVAFRPVLVTAAGGGETAASAPGDPLRAEVGALRLRLQATADELAASTAEHRAAHDRLQALNEELRTSREELEALNEELHTVNAELSAAEAASRASEARLEQIVDSVPHLVWTATADGRRDYFSRQWREYTGLAAGPMLDERWIEAYHPEDRPGMLAAWAESVRSGAPFEAEYRIRRHDGVYRWFKARGNPLRDAGGRVERWIGTSTDVDDVKRLEASLREGSRRKDEFMALLAHELRNPLAPIGNSLDILRLHGDRQHVTRAVEVIDRQLTHLTRLVDDLLDVSRITRGKIRIRAERLDLGGLLATILEDHRPLLAAAGLRLESALSRAPLWVEGDPARLAQMIENLLQNARKFTDPGGTVTVRAEASPDGRTVAVQVRDTGIGMEPGSVDRMFEAFAQGDATLAHSRGGLGLGLTLVRALAALHGGSVRGASDGPGRGSEFELRLPLSQPAADAVARTRPPSAPSRRVLVVDDNADAAETFAELLRLEGHAVRVVGDGRSALDEARRFLPEVAFCDIGLPGELDGYALARALRAEPGLEDVVLIAMTGYATEEDQRRSREAGFTLHLAKPARIETVTGALALRPGPGERREPPPQAEHPAAW